MIMGIRDEAAKGGDLSMAADVAVRKATPALTKDDSAALRDLLAAVKQFFGAMSKSPIAAVPMSAIPAFAELMEVGAAIDRGDKG